MASELLPIRTLLLPLLKQYKDVCLWTYFFLCQDYEHINTVFKSRCGMTTFCYCLSSHYYYLSNGPSLIPGSSVIVYYLYNGLKSIPGPLLFIQRSLLLIPKQQSLNGIFYYCFCKSNGSRIFFIS